MLEDAECCGKLQGAAEDTVFTISQKIQSHIDKNLEATHNNNADKFANAAFGVPGLARLVFWLAYHLDLHGLLPRKMIELSPFHTSLFITNLASINTSYIFHHCYEFGTTSVFVCMGKPVQDPLAPAADKAAFIADAESLGLRQNIAFSRKADNAGIDEIANHLHQRQVYADVKNAHAVRPGRAAG